MKRDDAQSSAVGHDSFLDIVTNMVGILIIFVMVIGMRVKNSPASGEPSPQSQAAAAALEQDVAAERTARAEIAQVMAQADEITVQTELRDRQRLALVRAVAAAEQKIAGQRDELDATARAEFDLARGIEEAKDALDRLRGQLVQAQSAPAAVEVVESYPPPMSKYVEGPERHFQLRNGRLAFVPIDALLQLAKDDVQSKVRDFVGNKNLTETANIVGPEGGFRFRYTLERYDETVRVREGMARREGVRMVEWTVVPVSSELGEPVDEALRPDSAFRRAMAGSDPQQTVVTVWVYADSFESFRKVRSELHRLGYACAARPLPDAHFIAGSVHGSKSSAE